MFKTSRRRLSGSLAAAGLAATAAVATAPAAHAAYAFDIHISPTSSFNLLLDMDSSSTAPGTPVIQWYANGGANQRWTFYSLGGAVDTYEIVNDNSGQCLTTDGVAGHAVVQQPCTGAYGQRWFTLMGTPDGVPYSIKNPASGLYLDVAQAASWAGAQIDVWYFNGNSNQSFLSE